MQMRLLITALILTIGFSEVRAQSGLGDGSDTLEGVMERSSILGQVYKQSKDSLSQARFTAGESKAVWEGDKTVYLTRTFSRVEQSKCHKIRIKAHAIQVGPLKEIVVRKLETRDLGFATDLLSCAQ